MALSAIILAGGKGSRMGGVNKALLQLDGATLIEKLVRQAATLTDDIVIVTNEPDAFLHIDLATAARAASKQGFLSAGAASNQGFPSPRFVSDVFPQQGPLAGIHAGLSAIGHEAAWVAGCDYPNADPALAAWLASRMDGHSAVIPVVGGQSQSLHAIYSKHAVPTAERLLRSGERRVYKLLEQLNTMYIDEGLLREQQFSLSFAVDIDTPEQYDMFKNHI